ncbi:hypothetical protein TWF694_001366 [Orbilia ellipsospora]|uniref:Uncharacterized protein n=1 Tax=Orbilia ellipsospora TaxID=2528407 RepID=A0AAV9XS70_9PEZI
MNSYEGPGAYVIISKSNGRPIGRHLVEDRSLNPKYILCLPQNAFEESDYTWQIQPGENGSLKMMTRGGTCVVMNGELKATLIPDMAEDFQCEFKPTSDQSGCNIVSAADGLAWTLPDQEGAEPDELVKMVVEPLNGSQNQVFELKRVEG